MHHRKYVAAGGRLEELRRGSTGASIQLEHVALDRQDELALRAECQSILAKLHAGWQQGQLQCLATAPNDDPSVATTLQASLAVVAAELRVAASPNQ